jgi:uncharacterized protein (TIGR02594 family)
MGKIADWEGKFGRIDSHSGKAGVQLVQLALMQAGASLVVDGEWGPITEAAVKAFQSAHDMPPVGYVGIHTAALLDAFDIDNVPPPAPSALSGAPWLSQMRAITGTKEFQGGADNPIIMAWKEDIKKAFPDMANYTNGYTHDSVPWCGLTMAAVMARCAPPIRPPFNPHDDTESYLYALSWLGFGTKCDPRVGAILVFSREGGGHVTLCEQVRDDKVWIRGGNQSDRVNVSTRMLDSSFKGARWPVGYPVVPLVGDIVHAEEPGSEV